MSAAVKLSSKMPGDFETNGLDAQAQRLVDEPDELMIAVVWIDTLKVVVDTDSGEHVPYIRIRRIEPLGDAGVVSGEIRDAVQKAIQERTGRKPIPFDVGEVVEGEDPDQMQIGDDS